MIAYRIQQMIVTITLLARTQTTIAKSQGHERSHCQFPSIPKVSPSTTSSGMCYSMEIVTQDHRTSIEKLYNEEAANSLFFSLKTHLLYLQFLEDRFSLLSYTLTAFHSPSCFNEFREHQKKSVHRPRLYSETLFSFCEFYTEQILLPITPSINPSYQAFVDAMLADGVVNWEMSGPYKEAKEFAANLTQSNQESINGLLTNTKDFCQSIRNYSWNTALLRTCRIPLFKGRKGDITFLKGLDSRDKKTLEAKQIKYPLRENSDRRRTPCFLIREGSVTPTVTDQTKTAPWWPTSWKSPRIFTKTFERSLLWYWYAYLEMKVEFFSGLERNYTLHTQTAYGDNLTFFSKFMFCNSLYYTTYFPENKNTVADFADFISQVLEDSALINRFRNLNNLKFPKVENTKPTRGLYDFELPLPDFTRVRNSFLTHEYTMLSMTMNSSGPSWATTRGNNLIQEYWHRLDHFHVETNVTINWGDTIDKLIAQESKNQLEIIDLEQKRRLNTIYKGDEDLGTLGLNDMLPRLKKTTISQMKPHAGRERPRRNRRSVTQKETKLNISTTTTLLEDETDPHSTQTLQVRPGMSFLFLGNSYERRFRASLKLTVRYDSLLMSGPYLLLLSRYMDSRASTMESEDRRNYLLETTKSARDQKPFIYIRTKLPLLAAKKYCADRGRTLFQPRSRSDFEDIQQWAQDHAGMNSSIFISTEIDMAEALNTASATGLPIEVTYGKLVPLIAEDGTQLEDWTKSGLSTSMNKIMLYWPRIHQAKLVDLGTWEYFGEYSRFYFQEEEKLRVIRSSFVCQKAKNNPKNTLYWAHNLYNTSPGRSLVFLLLRKLWL